MNSDFIRRVGACLAKLNVTFPHVACPVPATLVWAEAFDGIDIEDVEAGCREYIKYETKQPTPAHIRQRAKDIKEARIRESKAVKIGAVTYFSTGVPKVTLTSKPPHVLALIAKAEAEQKAAMKPQRVMSEEEIRARQQRKERMIGELKAMKEKVEQEKRERDNTHEST